MLVMTIAQAVFLRMARDGLMPTWFGRCIRLRTPQRALVVTGGRRAHRRAVPVGLRTLVSIGTLAAS